MRREEEPCERPTSTSSNTAGPSTSEGSTSADPSTTTTGSLDDATTDADQAQWETATRAQLADKVTQEFRLVSSENDTFEWLLGAYYTDLTDPFTSTPGSALSDFQRPFVGGLSSFDGLPYFDAGGPTFRFFIDPELQTAYSQDAEDFLAHFRRQLGKFRGQIPRQSRRVRSGQGDHIASDLLLERRRSPLGHQPAAVEERQPVAAVPLLHEMGGEEDGHPVAAELLQRIPEVAPRRRIETLEQEDA